jgi:hypothetical protein
MARTELFARNQPGGVFTIANWKDLPNDGWFVDSTAGTDGAGYGRNPDAPFDTLDYAVGNAAAGDKIYVAPWHVENLTTAISVEANIAGITIEGVKMGNLMPTFTATTAAGSITVSAANVTLKNLKLLAGFAGGCTVAITLPATALGCTLDGLVFRDSTTNLEWLLHVTVATGMTDLTIRNCDFVGLLGGTMVRSVFFVGTSVDTLIENSYWFVDSSDSVIDHSAGDSTNLRIRDNMIVNQDVDGTAYCIEIGATGTGVAYRNLMAYNNVGAQVGGGAAVFWLENYASNTIAESGRLDPTTAHAIP